MLMAINANVSVKTKAEQVQMQAVLVLLGKLVLPGKVVPQVVQVARAVPVDHNKLVGLVVPVDQVVQPVEVPVPQLPKWNRPIRKFKIRLKLR
jgi:hypothetical protein